MAWQGERDEDVSSANFCAVRVESAHAARMRRDGIDLPRRLAIDTTSNTIESANSAVKATESHLVGPQHSEIPKNNRRKMNEKG